MMNQNSTLTKMISNSKRDIFGIMDFKILEQIQVTDYFSVGSLKFNMVFVLFFLKVGISYAKLNGSEKELNFEKTSSVSVDCKNIAPEAESCNNTEINYGDENYSSSIFANLNIDNTPCAGENFDICCFIYGLGFVSLAGTQWSNGITLYHPLSPPCITLNLAAGKYTISVVATADNGATAYASVTFIVKDKPSVSITPSGQVSTCQSNPIVLVASTNATYAKYLWSDGSTSNNLTVNATGSYKVTVSQSGCYATSSEVAVFVPKTTISITPPIFCQGQNSQLAAVNTTKVNEYSFVESNGTYTPINGTLSTAIGNMGYQNNIPIGFNFEFNGAIHSTFYVSTNGILRFNPLYLGSDETNELSTYYYSTIAPLWDHNNATGGTIKYETTGQIGSRVLTVQWENIHIGNGGSVFSPTGSFQVKLFETTNQIQFIYGTLNPFYNTSASIGLAGYKDDFICVKPQSVSTISLVDPTYQVTNKTYLPPGKTFTFGRPVSNFSWSPATFLNSTSISSPLASAVTSATIYTVTSNNNSGCSSTATVLVIPAAPVTCGGIVSSKAIICSQSNFTLTCQTTGGITPLDYLWSDGSSNVFPNTNSLTQNLAPGTYTYTVTVTSCGATCSSSITIVVQQSPSAAITPNGSIKTCITNLPILLTAVSNATLPTYEWSNMSTNSSLNVDTSGKYSVIITKNGCSVASNVVSISVQKTIAKAVPYFTCTGDSSILRPHFLEVSSYDFAESIGVYSSIVGTLSTATGDNGYQSQIPIGFDFDFNGETKSKFNLTTNGELFLSNSFPSSNNNNLSTDNRLNIIAPLWDNHNATGGAIQYLTTGAVGSRILTVEWKNIHIGDYGASNSPIGSFQVKLYETTNQIQFIYGALNPFYNTSASIGIKGNLGDFISVTPNTISTASFALSNDSVSTQTFLPIGKTFTFNPIPTTYSWSPSTFLSATNIPYPIASNLASNTIYTVVANASNGCTSTSTVVANSNFKCSLSVVSPNSICSQTPFKITCRVENGIPYTYALSNGGTIYSSQTTVDFSRLETAGIKTYTVLVTSSCGATATASITVTVTQTPTSIVTPAGPINTCLSNFPIVLTTNTNATNPSYEWTGGTTNSILNVNTEGQYKVIVTNNGCSATSNLVHVNLLKTTAMAEPATLCAGGSTQLSAMNFAKPNQYTFSESLGNYVPIIGIPTSAIGYGGRESGIPIGFNFEYNEAKHTTFSVSTNGLITLSNNITSTMLPNNLPNATITNVIAAFWKENSEYGGAIQYLVTGSIGNRVLTVQWDNIKLSNLGSSSYGWGSFQIKLFETSNQIKFIYGTTSGSVPSSGSIGITGATGNFISVTPGTPSTTSIYVANDYVGVPVGKIYTFTPFATSYSWNPSTFLSATNISNPVASSVISTTSYTVTATSLNGCTATATTTIFVTPPPAPSIAGNLTFCQGDSSLLAVGAFSSYLWSTGATTQSIYVKAAGTYMVTVTNACGTSPSAAVVTSINAKPVATITSVGSTTFCNGGSVTLNASVGVGYTYAWKKNGVVIANATNASYVANKTGNYRVVVTNANGCSNLSVTKAVSVLPLPASTVTPVGPFSFCNGDSVILNANQGVGLSYQWKKGINNINGATTKAYTIKTGGVYKVIVTGTNGCSKVSNAVNANINCRIMSAAESNEITYIQECNSIYVSTENEEQETGLVRIWNTEGRIIFERVIVTNDNVSIEFHMPAGLYFVWFENDYKLLKSKFLVH